MTRISPKYRPIRVPRTWLLAAGIVLAATRLSPPAHADESVRGIIEESIRASGGYDDLAAVHGVRRKGDVRLTLLGETLEGKAELIVVPWQKAYQMVDVGIERLVQAWDGKEGWQDSYRQGRRKLEPREAAGVRLQAVLNPLIGYQMLYTVGLPVQRAEDATLDGAKCYVLRVDFDERSKLRVYVDKKTHFIVRLSLDAYAEQLGATFTINLDYGDYTQFDGIMLPQRTRLTIGQIFDLQTTYTNTEINPEIDESVFEYPGEPTKEEE